MEKEYVLITGSASGIGRACCDYFQKLDFNVIGIDLKKTSEVFQSFELDITNEVAVQKVFEHLESRNISFTKIIHAAGIEFTQDLHLTTSEDWLKTINVNLNGCFYVAKASINHFLKNRYKGSFVAISSDAGVKGASKYGAYCASKHGIIGLIKCLALEYGKYNIRANAVCPGFVETPMMMRLFEEATLEERNSYIAEVPLQRFAKPEEIAKVCGHLLSDEASYTNGSVYIVDGGVLAGHFE
ncbi:SDR family NAD(P)-dependent oxidoreductase [Acinetobacter pittii]|uniref:SDR family NAD(P)-dependent oxidoreductase n=1 Tax=Acinetobacter pittii TaxID=48296 RepID=UPI002A0A002F|nr:SDR family NAD(P)-dependent oxidoreductase [Acinetobacter pittii]MDX8237966.1 SDR family NAD(P)-dependent oxidoreductase [Acinetobacter pittii]